LPLVFMLSLTVVQVSIFGLSYSLDDGDGTPERSSLWLKHELAFYVPSSATAAAGDAVFSDSGEDDGDREDLQKDIQNMEATYRRLSYMLIHENLSHLMGNSLLQVLIGLLLLSANRINVFCVILTLAASVVCGSSAFEKCVIQMDPARLHVAGLVGASAGICGLYAMIALDTLLWAVAAAKRPQRPDFVSRLMSLINVILLVFIFVTDLIQLSLTDNYFCTFVVHLTGEICGIVVTLSVQSVKLLLLKSNGAKSDISDQSDISDKSDTSQTSVSLLFAQSEDGHHHDKNYENIDKSDKGDTSQTYVSLLFAQSEDGHCDTNQKCDNIDKSVTSVAAMSPSSVTLSSQ